MKLKYCMMEVDIPMVKQPIGPNLSTPQNVVAFVPELKGLAQEVMAVISLNTKYRPIEKRIVSVGIVDSSLAHPREIFRGAIQDNASAIILVHNHPSGSASPSAEDIRITRQMVEAGRILGIEVLDHVIVGDDNETPSYISLREAGLVSFC